MKDLPGRIKMPNGEFYRCVIMRVETTYDDLPLINGREIPEQLTYIDENRVMELSNGVRIITAYVPEHIFIPSEVQEQPGK